MRTPRTTSGCNDKEKPAELGVTAPSREGFPLQRATKLNKEGDPDLAAALRALLPELYSTDAWKKMREAHEALKVDAPV